MQPSKTTMETWGQENDAGRFVAHEPCDACGSSDARAIYDNGERGYAAYCFSCTDHQTFDQDFQPTSSAAASELVQAANKAKPEGLLQGEIQAIPARGISQEVCKKFGYRVGTYQGQPVQIATYYDPGGTPVAQKIRFKNKDFKLLGDGKKLPLFGSHRWQGGNRLVITEGELDAMSVASVMHATACVSLPAGAAAAVRAIKDNWDYVAQFKEVILCFDMDDPGRKAAIEVAELLPVGQSRICFLPYKDANETLLQGKHKDIVGAILEAKVYRPDGIVAAADIRDAIGVVDAASAIAYPFARLNEVTLGLREGELVTITAGSGIGKSTLVREIAYSLHTAGHRVGMIMLEESNKKTILGMLGIHMNKNVTVDRTGVEEADLYKAFDELFPGDNQVYLYDHFGSSEVDTIIQRIRYMVAALDVKWIILDHVSIMISGLAVADERKAIDIACTALRTLVSELNIGLIMVSHLRRPEGDKGHEEGSKVRLSQIRGSHSPVQLSDIVIGLQVDPDDPDGAYRYLHVLKNRFTGETGVAGKVKYNLETGRLLEASDTF